MSFRGCSTQLGCTILLKGAAAEQLASVKKITRVRSSAQGYALVCLTSLAKAA